MKDILKVLRERFLSIVIMILLGLAVCLLSELYMNYRIENSDYFKKEKLIAEIESEKTAEDRLTESAKTLLVDINNPGVIKCSGFVNLRSTPSLETERNIIATAENGAVGDITYTCEVDGITWYRLKFGRIEGYVNENYVLSGQKALKEIPNLVVKNLILNEDTEEYLSIDPLKFNGIILSGSYVKATEFDKDWYKIDNNGKQTYIKKHKGMFQSNVEFKGAEVSKQKQSFLNEYTNLGVYLKNEITEIKSEPSDDATGVGIITYGDGVNIEETVGDWCKITSGNVFGYIKADALITGYRAVNYGIEHCTLRAFIGDDTQDVYLDATRLSKIWTKLAPRQAYRVLDVDKYWVEIGLDSGEDADRAFINISDGNVKLKYSIGVAIPYENIHVNNNGPVIEEEVHYTANNTVFRNSIISYGCEFIGNPYVWGGTSLTNGTDCSGFTQSVLAHFGIHIPRVSRDQVNVGRSVSESEMRPGDLVFYANSSGTINHVAMYIGNGMVVMAGSAKTGIHIARWNYRTPVAMRDVIGGRER